MLTLKRAELKDAEIVTQIKIAAFNKDLKEFGPEPMAVLRAMIRLNVL
jgi:hypothetical protein